MDLINALFLLSILICSFLYMLSKGHHAFGSHSRVHNPGFVVSPYALLNNMNVNTKTDYLNDKQFVS